MSITYINELPDLNDILNDIIPEEDPLFFINEENTLDFIEAALLIMDDYIEENPTAISEPDFYDSFVDSVKELFFIQFEEHIDINEDIEDDMNDILADAFEIYFETFYQGRSKSMLPITELFSDIEADSQNINKNILQEKIDYLRSIPQPVQRTPEWYSFRHNLITASNAYKAFESQSTVNQLIYEKCQPLKSNSIDDKFSMVNLNSTFHWGQKYEPLSVLVYEYIYNTKIEDFGCIKHNIYNFLGASPDGINVDTNSPLYGRMLEIKNIVNREITGIPKKEYWIQTQLQMEVCDLDECDFLETKFTEYQSFSEFCEDGKEKTVKDEFKGIIMYFTTKEGKPFYIYKPLQITSYDDIDNWEEQMIEKYESHEHNMLWIKNHYWKLEKLSCVLILRNRKWFQDNIGQLEKVWNIILKERETGFEHRAPNKRVKKESTNNKNEFQGCLLNINKPQDKIIVNKLD